MGWGSVGLGSSPFLKKRTKKLLLGYRGFMMEVRDSARESFLLLFFKKEVLP
jgi:hypothetical protein